MVDYYSTAHLGFLSGSPPPTHCCVGGGVGRVGGGRGKMAGLPAAPFNSKAKVREC